MPTVVVKNIATGTSPEQIKKFFSFCGKIKDAKFEKEGETQTATIEFEKDQAARTALLLDGGNLEGSSIQVTSPDVSSEGVASETPAGGEGEHISQEDKPRSAIVAQYLAAGYHLTDEIVQRAIDLDGKHGISNRFLGYLKRLDTEAGKRVDKSAEPPKTLSETVYAKAQEFLGVAQAKAKEIDEKQHITEKSTAWFGPYYNKALQSPYAAKVQEFYSQASKNVLDVHEEAKRIAAEKKNGDSPAPQTAAAAPSTSTAPAAQPTA